MAIHSPCWEQPQRTVYTASKVDVSTILHSGLMLVLGNRLHYTFLPRAITPGISRAPASHPTGSVQINGSRDLVLRDLLSNSLLRFLRSDGARSVPCQVSRSHEIRCMARDAMR